MAKKLSERIAEGVARRQSPAVKNRAAFLSLRDDIIEAMDAGWSRKAIWEQLRSEGKIGFGYVKFCAYVRESIVQPKESPKAGTQESAPPTPDSKKEPSSALGDGPVVLKPADKKRFIHSSQPNKEDLL